MQQKKFAFLVHPRNRRDWQNNFFLSRIMPNRLLNYIGKLRKEMVLSHITYKDYDGYLIAVPLLPEFILSKPLETQKYVLEAVKYAVDNLGVEIIGLGALLAPITINGKWLQVEMYDKYPDKQIIVTNANSLTAAVTVRMIKIITSFLGISQDFLIAIIGASTSIGIGVCKLFAQDLIKPHLLLIDKRSRKLESLQRQIVMINKNAVPGIATSSSFANNAQVVIILNSAPEFALKAHDLMRGAVIYNVAQPSNFNSIIAKMRKDILVIDGGLIKATGLDLGINLQLPNHSVFAGLVETMLLTKYNNFEGLEFIGDVDTRTALEMLKKAQEQGFENAPLTSYNGLIVRDVLAENIYILERKQHVYCNCQE